MKVPCWTPYKSDPVELRLLIRGTNIKTKKKRPNAQKNVHTGVENAQNRSNEATEPGKLRCFREKEVATLKRAGVMKMELALVRKL